MKRSLIIAVTVLLAGCSKGISGGIHQRAMTNALTVSDLVNFADSAIQQNKWPADEIYNWLITEVKFDGVSADAHDSISYKASSYPSLEVKQDGQYLFFYIGDNDRTYCPFYSKADFTADVIFVTTFGARIEWDNCPIRVLNQNRYDTTWQKNMPRKIEITAVGKITK